MAANKIIKVSYPQSLFSSYLDVLQSRSQLFQSRHDPEDLHQLRTFCRRLRNALWIYKKSFPKIKLDRWDRSLKRLAKVTGSARDLDVHIIFLNQYKTKNKTSLPLINDLLHDLSASRKLLQSELIKNLQLIKKQKLFPELRLVTSKIILSKEDLFRLARKKISKRIKTLFKYKKFAKDETNSKQLHKIRIAAKHLRYTLEGFESLFEKEFQPFTLKVQVFQQTLGRVHDLDVWNGELLRVEKKHRSSHPKSLKKLTAYCQRSRKDSYDQFIKSWNQAKEKNLFKSLKKLLKSRDKGEL